MNDTKDATKKRRIQMSTQALIDLDVDFTVHNHGFHIIIDAEEYGMIDFWPSTGRWTCRDSDHRGDSFSSLLDHLGVPRGTL